MSHWMSEARRQFFYAVFMAYSKLEPGNNVLAGQRGREVELTGFTKLVRSMEEDSLMAPGTMVSSGVLAYADAREIIKGKRASQAFGAFKTRHGANILYLEHVESVTAFIREVISEADAGTLTFERFSELLERMRPLWITQEENERLNKAGFRCKRPGGWMAAYNQVGIKIQGL